MRWFMHFDSPCVMSVDNAVTVGMDFSELIIDDPDLYVVNWQDGKGEIERQEVVDGSDEDNNLNGLREGFYDITPYVPLFQQFLTRLQEKNLLLDQAKKIQIDLIKQLYESKRQLPFHYPVAAGDYWWDASDSGTASVIPSISSLISSVNNVISRVNDLVLNKINPHISLVMDFATEVQTDVVTYANNGFNVVDQICTHLQNAGNSDQFHLNNNMFGLNTSPAVTVNYLLKQTTLTVSSTVDGGGSSVISTPTPALVASPGINGNIPWASYNWLAVSASNPYRCQPINSFFPALSWSNIPAVSVPTSNWVPIGGTNPVPVTPQESAAIINGISARTQQLQTVRNSKIAEVNALTEIEDVIAYDVLAGWPDIPLPPGYKLEAPVSAASSVTVVGTPAAPTEGVPEAPSDGVTYGRRNQIWNPALALSGDVLDGGSF